MLNDNRPTLRFFVQFVYAFKMQMENANDSKDLFLFIMSTDADRPSLYFFSLSHGMWSVLLIDVSRWNVKGSMKEVISRTASIHPVSNLSWKWNNMFLAKAKPIRGFIVVAKRENVAFLAKILTFTSRRNDILFACKIFAYSRQYLAPISMSICQSVAWTECPIQ